MAKRKYNPNLVKIHRNYTVDELASLYRVHKNTVRQWIKEGLRVCDDVRPYLVLGSDLRDFLRERRIKNKHPCLPGLMYCLKCRQVQIPLGRMVDYVPKTDSTGTLVGICSNCETMMYQIVGLARLEKIRSKLEITMPQAEQHISGCY